MNDTIYKYAVGIDLGTTNSSLSYINLEDKHPKIIDLWIEQQYPNGRQVSDIKLPSVVYIKDDKIYIGLGAEENKYSSIKERNVFFSSKSQLGQKYLYHKSKNESLTKPYHISGLILKALVGEFKRRIHSDLNECKFVITVPASFGGTQRSDTIKAIEFSGLKYFEGMLVDEPNAAFIGYIDQVKDFNCPQGSNILVFDMGGGTTDISILDAVNLNPGALDLRNLAVSRYDLLGGDDIDAHIAQEYLLKIFLQQNDLVGNEFMHAEMDKIVLSRLKKIAKALKETICEKIQWIIDESEININNGLDLEIFVNNENLVIGMPDEIFKIRNSKYSLINISLNIEQFLNLMTPFLNSNGNSDKRDIGYNRLSIYPIINHLLDVANLKKEDINYILCIGGSPKNTIIQNSIKNYFNDAALIIPENIDLLVARGAVVYADKIIKNEKAPIPPIISDNIGIIIQGQRFSSIIKAGIEVPYPKDGYKISSNFIPPEGNGTVTIPICIGDKSRIYEMIQLDRSEVDDKIKIGMKLDLDKMLKVKIYSGDQEIDYTFENPITVYISSDPNIATLHHSLYEYQKAVLENDKNIEDKQIALISDLMNANRHSEAYQYIKLLLNNTNNKSIKGYLLFKAGYNCSELGLSELAIKYYMEYLIIHPNNSAASLNLGLEYDNIKDLENAISVLQLSVENGNAHPATKIYLGKLMIRNGDSIKSVEDMIQNGIDNLIKLEGLTIFHYHWIIVGYRLIGNKKEANYWILMRDEMNENQKISYNNDELLKHEIEEVEL
jgi:molecular chaperone DnaK